MEAGEDMAVQEETVQLLTVMAVTLDREALLMEPQNVLYPPFQIT